MASGSLTGHYEPGKEIVSLSGSLYLNVEAAKRIVAYAQHRAMILASGLDEKNASDTCVGLIFEGLAGTSLVHPICAPDTQDEGP